MEKSYCLELKVHSPFSTKQQWNHTHLLITEEVIELRVFIESERDIQDFMNWYNSTDYDSLVAFSEVKVSEEEEELTSVDFSRSLVTGMSSGHIDNDSRKPYLGLTVDHCIIRRKSKKWEKPGEATVFLDADGFDLVSDYYSFLSAFRKEGRFDISRKNTGFYKLGKSKFRPEFMFKWSDSRNSPSPKIEKIPILKLQFADISEDELFDYIEIACNICSFYFGKKIDYISLTFNFQGETIFVRQIREKRINLKVATLFSIMDFTRVHDFLKKDWQKQYLTKKGKIHRAINNYLQARALDASSRFLLLYSIIEISMAGTKIQTRHFDFAMSKSEREELYDEVLRLLKTSIRKPDHREYEKKWLRMKENLDERPKNNPVADFLKQNKIPVDQLTISFDRIRSLRNKITHGSVSSIDTKEVDKANVILFNIATVLILNQLGIRGWKWPL